MPDVPEADWMNFRQLALERFCKRTLDELQPIVTDASSTYHDRYLEVFRVLNARDYVLADAFNNSRRSDMMRQLLVIVGLGLVEPRELDSFSEGTRSMIERFVERKSS